MEWKAVIHFNYFLSNRFSIYAGTMPEIMTEIFELHTIASRYSPQWSTCLEWHTGTATENPDRKLAFTEVFFFFIRGKTRKEWRTVNHNIKRRLKGHNFQLWLGPGPSRCKRYREKESKLFAQLGKAIYSWHSYKQVNGSKNLKLN